MAKMENVTVYVCDVCGKIEIPKCIGCDSEDGDDLPVGWTRLYEKVTMCSICTRAQGFFIFYTLFNETEKVRRDDKEIKNEEE